MGARPAYRRTPGDAGVGQEDAALPAFDVREANLDETSPVIALRASLTERARAEICRRVGQDAAAVAREFGIGWRAPGPHHRLLAY
jgi:hypothetical protein